MAFNQPSSSNSALDSTFLVFDEDYVSELRARLIDSVSRFGTVDPLSMMSLLEAERQISESKNQNSESGSLTAQPVQAPDQDYFYDKYLTSSVRKQMAKSLNMTEQQLETFLQNRRSEEKRLLDQFKKEDRDRDISNANHPGISSGDVLEFWNSGTVWNQDAGTGNQEAKSGIHNSGAQNQNVESGNQNSEITSQKTDSGAQNTECGNLSSQQFSPQQVQALRQKYLRDPYPSPSDRKELAESIGLTEKQVKYWFHDKRFEDRIAHKQSEKWSANRHGSRAYRAQQVEAMEQKFAVKPFLTLAERKELAERIGLKESEVKKWFQDRRDDEKYKEDVETDPDFSDSESDYDMDEPMEQYPKKFSCQSNKRDRDTNANRSVVHHAEAEHQSLGGLPNQGFYPYRSYATTFPSYWYPQLTNSDLYYTCNPLNSSMPSSEEVLRQKLDSGNREAESGIQNSGAENQNAEGGNQNSEIASQKTDSGAQNTESGNLSSQKFSPEQVQALEHQYVRCPYLSPSERKQLAKSIGLTEKQVKYWFHDQRSEGRRLGMQYAKCSANRHCISRTYLAEQVKAMEQKFATKQFLTLAERKELAESIGLEESEVKEWFQDRRESEEDKEDGESDFHSDSDYDYEMDESMERYPNEFSCQQVEDLEQQFAKNKYLTRDVRKELAKSNNLTERQVKTWFQDRRFDELRVKEHSNKGVREDTNGEVLLQKLDSLEHKVTNLLASKTVRDSAIDSNSRDTFDGFDDNMSSLLARLNAGNGNQNSGIREKRKVNFSPLQSQALEQQFAINKDLTDATRAELARWTNLTESKVNIWFQDRRLRQNREEQKEKDIDSFVKNYVNLPDASKPLSSFEAKKLTKEFTRQQVEAMEQKFVVKQCLTLSERKQLAGSIGLKEGDVKEWFQDRREEEENKEDSFSDVDKLLKKPLEVKNEELFLYERARRNVGNFCKLVVPWVLLMIFACMIAIKLTIGIECRRNDYH